jgi:LysM repeat protein
MPVGRGVTKTPASGIGDDAVFGTQPPVSALTVKKGDFFFAISVYGFPLDQPQAIDQVQAKERALALQILSKL